LIVHRNNDVIRNRPRSPLRDSDNHWLAADVD
jgi:hypothetical protein